MVLFIVCLPAQIFAANEENEPEAFSSEKMLEKFPEANFSPTRGYGTIRKASDGKTLSEQSMTDKTIVPKDRYHTLDNEGDFYLDVYDDGSFSYYGYSYEDAVSRDWSGTEGIVGTITAPTSGGGYVTYTNIKAFWTSGSSSGHLSSLYHCMYFSFDYKMKYENSRYEGEFIRVYDSNCYPGPLNLLQGYRFVTQTCKILNSTLARLVCALFDNEVNHVTDVWLSVQLTNTSYRPTATFF